MDNNLIALYFSPARYSWCSKRLIEERYSWSNQLTLADLIPLETPVNSTRPPGGKWKERLIVGHNVSFDRSYIKEQYLLKVSIQKFLFGSLLICLCCSLFIFSFCISIAWFFHPCCVVPKGSKVRFMDTMSLHMSISGLTGFQRTLWMANRLGKKRGLQDVKEHIKKTGQKREGPMVCLHHPSYPVSVVTLIHW